MSKKLIQGLAQNLFKKTEDQVADLFGDDDAIDEAKVIDFFKKELSAKVKEVGENQLGRGRKDAHGLWNKIIKEKANALDVELGEELSESDLVEALLSGVKPATGKATELTVDQLKQLPLYKQVLDEEVKALKQKIADTEADKAKSVAQVMAQLNRSTAEQAAFDALEAAKWRKGESDEEITRRKSTIMDLLRLHTNNFQSVKVDGGKVFLVDEKGEIRKDDLHNPIEYSAFVSGLNPFGVHDFDPGKGSTGASSGQKNNTGSDYKIADGVSLPDALNGVTDLAQKAKIIRAYSAAAK